MPKDIFEQIKTGTFETHSVKRQVNRVHKFPQWMIDVANAKTRDDQIKAIDKDHKDTQMVKDHMRMELIRLRAKLTDRRR